MKNKNFYTDEEILEEILEFKNNKYMKEENFLDTLKINVKCKSPGQKELIKTIRDKEITFVSGMAGTGKTYVTCLQALKLLKNKNKFQKIVITKSVTTIPGEEVGFLKGTLEEKMDPFMWSFWTNFEKIIGRENLRKMKELGYIEIWPLAYIRGSNLDSTICIVDESQNITKSTVKTIITRLGHNSKMIFLGDSDQIDIKRPENSALSFYIDNFKDFSPFGIVELGANDEIRNPIIPKYLEKLESIEKNI